MGIILRVNENGKTKYRLPGYEKLNSNALYAHDLHMEHRKKAIDNHDLKLMAYHSTAARLVMRKGRKLNENEKKSLWTNKTKKFGRSNNERQSYLFNKYPGLKRLSGK